MTIYLSGCSDGACLLSNHSDRFRNNWR
jgi:hypothetical protein